MAVAVKKITPKKPKLKRSKIVSVIIPVLLVVVISVISISPYVLTDKYVFDLEKTLSRLVASTSLVKVSGQTLMLQLEVDALNQDSFDQTWEENGKEYRYNYEIVDTYLYNNSSSYSDYEKYDEFGNMTVIRKKLQVSVIHEITTVVNKAIHYLGFLMMPFAVLISVIPLLLTVINPHTWFTAIN